jgi:hypothetical protein
MLSNPTLVGLSQGLITIIPSDAKKGVNSRLHSAPLSATRSIAPAKYILDPYSLPLFIRLSISDFLLQITPLTIAQRRDMSTSELLQKANQIIDAIEIPDRHSFFQIEKFMIGSQPTGQSQLWQIARELKVRIENITAIKQQMDDTKDTIEELDIQEKLKNIDINEFKQSDPPGEKRELRVKSKQIEAKKLSRLRQSAEESLKNLKKKVKYILEEANCLVDGYEAIIARVGPMKPWDDIQSQKEMWNEKFLEEFNLRVILKRPLETDFVKSVLSLDDDAPVKKHVVGLIENIQKQMIADQARALAAQAAIKSQVETKTKIER